MKVYKTLVFHDLYLEVAVAHSRVDFPQVTFEYLHLLEGFLAQCTLVGPRGAVRLQVLRQFALPQKGHRTVRAVVLLEGVVRPLTVVRQVAAGDEGLRTVRTLHDTAAVVLDDLNASTAISPVLLLVPLLIVAVSSVHLVYLVRMLHQITVADVGGVAQRTLVALGRQVAGQVLGEIGLLGKALQTDATLEALQPTVRLQVRVEGGLFGEGFRADRAPVLHSVSMGAQVLEEGALPVEGFVALFTGELGVGVNALLVLLQVVLQLEAYSVANDQAVAKVQRLVDLLEVVAQVLHVLEGLRAEGALKGPLGAVRPQVLLQVAIAEEGHAAVGAVVRAQGTVRPLVVVNQVALGGEGPVAVAALVLLRTVVQQTVPLQARL
ncbi:hypothetical protein TYRP_007621 [Tyrophagus putrescentiae]|nr:hypothetical protein TYRP_007621 [Tyrophagus putrescentiae]